MSILLDTHVIIWYANSSPNLSAEKRKLIEAEEKVYISIASFWEISIKIKLNKLDLNISFKDLESLIERIGISVLPISFADTAKLMDLDFHHQDPFDRMIIAQSINNNIPILSKDEQFDAYGIQRIW